MGKTWEKHGTSPEFSWENHENLWENTRVFPMGTSSRNVLVYVLCSWNFQPGSKTGGYIQCHVDTWYT